MRWTIKETQYLIQVYPYTLNSKIKDLFNNRSEKSIKRKAEELGLKKSAKIRFETYSKATKVKWKQKKFKPEYTRLKQLEGLKCRDQRGNKNPNWKDKKRPRRNRQCYKYIAWRKQVFLRDNFTCQITGQVGGRLEAHHIKTFNNYKDLRYSVDNGITLNAKFHKSIRGKESLWENYFLSLIEERAYDKTC
jgi:5-methylcytosine-specific restriction endonuclease McrA